MSEKLTEKALLVSLSISQWGARVEDKKATKEVETKFNAKKAGKFYKSLMEESAKEIAKIASRARQYHYENTLPWDKGRDVLLSENYLDYREKMADFEREMNHKVDEFVARYEQEIEYEKQRLGGLFNIADYPLPETLRTKYAFSVTPEAIQTADDFRVKLNDEEVDRIKKEITERLENRQKEAMRDVWKRLYDVVSHMAEKIKDKDIGKNVALHQSLIDNITKLCDMLPKLNLTGDEELDKMAKEIKESITKYPVDDIRDYDNIRKHVISETDKLLSKMDGFI